MTIGQNPAPSALSNDAFLLFPRYRMGSASAQALATALPQMRCLCLDLRDNGIDAAAALSVASALEVSRDIAALDLRRAKLLITFGLIPHFLFNSPPRDMSRAPLPSFSLSAPLPSPPHYWWVCSENNLGSAAVNVLSRILAKQQPSQGLSEKALAGTTGVEAMGLLPVPPVCCSLLKSAYPVSEGQGLQVAPHPPFPSVQPHGDTRTGSGITLHFSPPEYLLFPGAPSFSVWRF